MRSSILKSLRQAAALFLVYALPVATLPAGASPYGLGQAAPPTDTQAVTIPPDQLDSLVAPIALYPDPLLAQMLAASTYPLEIIQLQQFLDSSKSLTGQALTNAVMQQNWDPSVQAMAEIPDALKVLSQNIKWTTDLGNAFLAQQNDVMNAVQRMRAKAQGSGQLKSSSQQTVETKVVEDKTVVVIEPSSPDVVYVPSYDPMVMYGAPAYPYPPVYYPGYVAGAAISFGAGLAIGAAWGGGGWGWNCGWGGNNNININNNNNFINNNNRQNINNPNRAGNRPGGGNNWQHDPGHRGGTPYGDRNTANKFGGTTRGDSLGNRQASARQNIGQGQFGGQGQMGNRQQGGFGNRGAGGPGGGDRVGTRDVSRGSGSGAFGGASSGMSGRDARASQSRGASSMGSRGSSGRSAGSGGGRSGGRSGGGGGRRR